MTIFRRVASSPDAKLNLSISAHLFLIFSHSRITRLSAGESGTASIAAIFVLIAFISDDCRSMMASVLDLSLVNSFNLFILEVANSAAIPSLFFFTCLDLPTSSCAS